MGGVAHVCGACVWRIRRPRARGIDGCAPNAPPRPNITVTAEVVVRFGTTMVLQPDDSFPRFPATQGEAAAVHFTLGETTVLCPDYTIPPHHDASRRR